MTNVAMTVPLPPPAVLLIPDESVQWSYASVHRSGLVDAVARWHADEPRGVGGPKIKFPFTAVVVAMQLASRHALPMNMTTYVDILFKQISPEMRTLLNVPEPPAPDNKRGWANRYRQMRHRVACLMKLMDPSPNPKNHRLLADDWQAVLEKHAETLEGVDLDERRNRLFWFINQILDDTFNTIPDGVRANWNGSVCVDATPVPAFAKGPVYTRGKKNKALIKSSADPDAGWYTRTPDQRDADEAGRLPAKKGVHAYEATLMIMGSDTYAAAGTFPYLVVGMDVLHIPGTEPGVRSTRVLNHLASKGRPSALLAGDRAYSNALPADYHLPTRALSYKHVFDYRIDQLGLQGSYEGFILVDGWWYCRDMPAVLITATLDFRNGVIDEAMHKKRIELRRAYEARYKEHPDEHGDVRLMCPAAGACPTAACEMKLESINSSTRTKLRISLTDETRALNLKSCSQQSVTIPYDEGAKFVQELRHESPEWHAAYGPLRNTIEGFNGKVKNDAVAALAASQRRRKRGVAYQSVAAAFLIAAENLRQIEGFLAEAVDDGGVLRRPRHIRQNSLRNHRPEALPAAV